MGKIPSIFLYIVIASAIDYGLYPFIFQHMSFPFDGLLVGAISAGEVWGLVKIVSDSSR